MRSIVFAGRDLSEFCSAEVVARSAHPVAAEWARVPGRAGGLIASGYVPPVDVTVRLFLDPGYRPGAGGMAALRSRLRRWLCEPGGGALVLPDDPEMEYRDALLTAASGWSGLLEDGSCELTFTLFDPIGYGAERVERGAAFEVGGNWRTWPEIRLSAAAGDAVRVADSASGRYVLVERAFFGGEAVVIGCDDESVSVDGADARALVALGSDFFWLEPGDALLAVEGASSVEVRFRERWA